MNRKFNLKTFKVCKISHVSGLIVQTLVRRDVQHTFMVIDGGTMFRNEVINNNSRLRYFFNLPTQACYKDAEDHAWASGRQDVVNAIFRPRKINTLNGVFSTWINCFHLCPEAITVKKNVQRINQNRFVPLPRRMLEESGLHTWIDSPKLIPNNFYRYKEKR